MRRSHVTVVLAGLTSLSLLGVTAAFAGEDPPAEDGVVEEPTTTTSTTEPPTTTSTEGTTTTADETDGSEAEEPQADDLEAEAEEEAEEVDGAGVHPENHGKYVSDAAKTCPPGPGHGACVSTVARSDVGKGTKKPHDRPEKADDAD